MIKKGFYKQVKIVYSLTFNDIEFKIDDIVEEMESKNWALDSCQLVHSGSSTVYANLTFVNLVDDDE